MKKRKRARAFVVSKRRDIADFFGVSLNAVEKWRERGMPGTAGKWDLAAIAKWLRRRSKRQESGADPDRKLKRIKIAMALIRLREERGRVMARADHESYCLRLCTLFRSALLSLPPTLAVALEGKDLPTRVAAIRERLTEVLMRLSGEDGDATPSAKTIGRALDAHRYLLARTEPPPRAGPAAAPVGEHVGGEAPHPGG